MCPPIEPGDLDGRHPPTLDALADARSRSARVAAIQLAILLSLCAAAFRNELLALDVALQDGDAAHALAAPLIILVLFQRWRRALVESLAPGSLWGAALLLASIGVYILSAWPFNYALPRRAAIVPAVAGAILAVGGWRAVRLSIPMLLVLLVAIPTGSRYFAFLVIKPETHTLAAARATLDLLPGVFVDLEGADLSYSGSHGMGTIALGEHHRGAGLLLSYLCLGILVASYTFRPWWQLLALAAAAPAIVLFCNYARLLLWGMITIYGGAGPLSPMPRLASAAGALMLAYAAFGLLAIALSKILAEPPESTGHSAASVRAGMEHDRVA